jgi:membrane protease YdiL (CAAX protease family)
LRVTVKGDRVGYFTEYLKVPESFSRNYTEIRSRAGLLSNIASVFFLALGIAMVVVLVQKYRQNTVIWRAALSIGILVTATYFVASLNGYPLTQFGFDTTQSFPSFILNFIFGSLFSAFSIGAIIMLSGTAGGAATQDVEGWRNPLTRLSLRGWRSSGFARTALIGYGLAFAHLGYVTLFYVLGNDYLGVWSPAGMTEYSNTYSTYLPWIYPLLIGLMAATMEEFFFRLLAISLLMKWFNKTWLAVLIPAIVWAFLHANYPQEPIYIRGLELTIVGIVFGIVFLRYGVWATIISHYVYNCFLGVYPMIQSDSIYFKISGSLAVAVVFIPAIPAIFGAVTDRYKEVEEEPLPEPDEAPLPLETEPESSPEPEVERKTPADYLLPQNGLIIFGVLAIIGFALYAGIDNQHFGEYATEKIITRKEAIQKAEAYRQQLGLDLEGYQKTVWFSSGLGSSHFAHLIRNTTLTHADTLAADETGSWDWNIRWFKPLEKEELTISINSHGNLSRISHPISENQEGAKLNTEDAQKTAEVLLAEHFDRNVTNTAQYNLLEDRSQKRENRMDYTFVWERTDIKVAEGEFRVQVNVQGDQIGRVSTYYKAPEEFMRKLREQYKHRNGHIPRW